MSSCPDHTTIGQKFFLESLPPEIINHVLQYLPKDALANVRRASKSFQEQAAPFLYRQFILRYSIASAAKARELINRPDLAGLVRDFRFEAPLPSVFYTSTYSTYEQVRHITQDLRFDRMDSLSIAFDDSIAFDVTASEVYGRSYASDIFTLAFSSFNKSPLQRPTPPRRYSLSIENAPSDYRSTSLDISGLLQNTRRLELSTITLQNCPIHSNTKQLYRGAMSFYAGLPGLWLVPASQSLTVLHLSADAPWGWYPKIIFRDIHFPHLKDLMLSRFTFSHDWQMDWLLKHKQSLKRLSLIGCAILDHATSTRQYFDSEGYPLGIEPGWQGPGVMGSYKYQKRWSDYFEGFANFLPNLQSFSLLAPGLVIRDTYHQDILDDQIVRASLAHDRYLKYTSVHYTPLFTDWGYIGSGQIKQDKEDPRALRELLVVIRRRNRTFTQMLS